jgi:hypothetical protein
MPPSCRRFRADHERHTQNLKPFVQQLGGKVPDGAGVKALLTTGKVLMGSIAGDKAILMAMKTNEDDTNTAYERAHGHADLTPEMREVLRQNLADEHRHRAWIVESLNAM